MGALHFQEASVSEHLASRGAECALMELKGHYHPGPLTAGVGACVTHTPRPGGHRAGSPGSACVLCSLNSK